jgi:hypothetical protein
MQFVCSKNSGTDVVVMKSAKDGVYLMLPIRLASDRRILVQGMLRSNTIVMVRVGFQPTKCVSPKTMRKINAALDLRWLRGELAPY